ncbi:SLBB domain-containing protein [candidate division KSB1 bacterium]|nr:SLBB domain-containing protein [candidate division KSB1 bacterium]
MEHISRPSLSKIIFWLAGLSILLLIQVFGQQTNPSNLPNYSNQMSSSQVSPSTKTEVSAAPRVYGYDLFNIQRAGGDELGAQILPPDYILGPGDRLGIYMSGSAEPVQYDVTVNVEGKLFIPSIGALPVAGLTLDGFRNLLNKKIARYYANYDMEILLLSPKFIRVAIVGEVERPGYYDLNALNTMVEAVIKAGGPTLRGSLRNIQLFRNNECKAVLDLYAFLIQGKTFGQPLLQTGDRIFVPLMEAKIKVTGEVLRPEIFELKTNAREYLKNIIQLAGGFTSYAYLKQIEISRLTPERKRELINVNYHEIMADSTNPGPLIQNEDWIHIHSIRAKYDSLVVSIYGEVQKPGVYPWQENMRVNDLILLAGNITRMAYTLSAEVAKIDPLKHANVIKVDLENLLKNPDSPENILLEEDDIVFIRKIPKWEIGAIVEVQGEVKFPGIYPIKADSTWLSEILNQCGGFTEEALIREATVIRKSTRVFIDKEYERLKTMSRDEMSESEYQYFVMKQNQRDVGQVLVDFYKLMIHKDKSEDIYLKNGDIIQIPRAPVVVQVTGRVSRQGGVLYKKGMKLSYYLKKAGGATWDANIRDTKVTKVTGEILDYTDVDELVAGDIIWVPPKPHRDWWAIFRDTMTVFAQIATIYLIIQNASK